MLPCPLAGTCLVLNNLSWSGAKRFQVLDLEALPPGGPKACACYKGNGPIPSTLNYMLIRFCVLHKFTIAKAAESRLLH